MLLNVQNNISTPQNNLHFGNRNILMRDSRLKFPAGERLLNDSMPKFTKEQEKSIVKFLKKAGKQPSKLKETIDYLKFEFQKTIADLFIK